ncbi:hypothetical protein G6F17_008310 [Rhizopus arrhizus]|nr:hypothetical protein G6F20_008144 [Rhizopus arrhizus]KAG0852215.1 hypothetical protein G6F17_008310 [Rhizopus arrhizus]KAG0907597.1 hypothetical protein G6F33_010433 [Rhizopus arrhizus]KAG1185337.1 hypothetical protein G6F36_007013 [Rhizopus arrhizus]
MTDRSPNNEQRTYTEQGVFELLGRFKIEEQTATQRIREERELPLEITSSLDKVTKQQHQDNFKRYKREISKYHHEEWTVAEEINKSFLPKLKQFTVDTTQVVNAHYKGAENSRLHGRAATEIFEQLLTIKSGELTADEANQLLDEALESARRLAIHAWVQGKQHDEDAKDYATRALRLPPSLKHLEAKESGSKREDFSEEFIAKYSEANYQQRVLRAAMTSSPVIEEDVDFMDEVEQKTIFGEGDVGSRPSTTTVIPTISTVQHQQTIQHRERPTSNTTNITIFSTTSSIITSSFTSSIINPYYNFNNQLHHSLRWHSTGQSPTTFPPLLENNNQSSLAFIRDSKWLQNPIYQKTDPMEESEENDDNRRSTSYQRSSTKIPEWTDDRGNDKEKTDPGLPKIELVHPSRTLQAGESSSTKRTYGKRRLHLQNRFKRRIRSCPNTRRLPRLFKLRERRNCLPIQIPSEQQLATWDVSILMDYITNQLSPTSTLSLAQLQLKTILLFCIATMWRPRSDIGRLQYRDVILNQDDMTTNIRIHARKPKEGQIKSIILGTVEDNQVCPVRTAHESILQTAVKRQTLTEDHIFLLTYLDSSKKQATSVRPTTVTNWIKAAMDKAGIDINHY